MTPAIVVLGFNRPESLRRVLESIRRAAFSVDNIPLIISIDNGRCKQTLEVANEFCWERGEKRVIQHEKNLGMRAHSIFCCDLTEEFESIVFVEDDSYLSPYFYDFSQAALSVYKGDDNVAGISLYNFEFNEFTGLNFSPIDDGYDNYFIQTATTWGVVWTRTQWRNFRAWLDEYGATPPTHFDHLPEAVIHWPSTSWKKYINKYLVESNRFFLYPRSSLLTNFADPGAHFSGKNSNFQVSILMGEKVWRLSTLGQSVAIYDSFFELHTSVYRRFNKSLEPYNFCVNIHNIKSEPFRGGQYVLTTRDAKSAIISFGCEMRPIELNVLLSAPGSFLRLVHIDDYIKASNNSRATLSLHANRNLGLRSYISIVLHLAWKMLRTRLIW